MNLADEAEFLPETERAEALRRVQAAVAGPGQDSCASCGDDIDVERRAALPSARRCLPCQQRHERRQFGRARQPIIGDGL